MDYTLGILKNWGYRDELTYMLSPWIYSIVGEVNSIKDHYYTVQWLRKFRSLELVGLGWAWGRALQSEETTCLLSNNYHHDRRALPKHAWCYLLMESATKSCRSFKILDTKSQDHIQFPILLEFLPLLAREEFHWGCWKLLPALQSFIQHMQG